MIRQGGVYINGERIEDIALKLDMKNQPELILKVGKKKFYKLLRK